MSQSPKNRRQSSSWEEKSISYRDATFGRKLEHREGVIGYQFPSTSFRGKHLAGVLDIGQSQLSRKKNGTDPIAYWELSKLIELYQLDGSSFNYELFMLPLEEFKAALRKARVGTYGKGSAASARQSLLVEAKPNQSVENEDQNTGLQKQPKISIEIVRHQLGLRAGGFGLSPPKRREVPNFEISEQVFFRIAVPGPGYLYVLSDLIDIEMTCLMPSVFAEHTEVTGGKTRVPMLSSFFDVLGPPAYYRLFAIHCTENVWLPWLRYDKSNPEPATVPELELPRLIEKLKLIRATGGEFSVASKDYRVLQ